MSSNMVSREFGGQAIDARPAATEIGGEMLRTTTDRERALHILTVHGRNSTGYMTLWHGNRVFFGPGKTCYIGYRQVGRVALALGDPIGPPEAIAPTITAFVSYCRARHWIHAFHAATPQMLPIYERLGYRAVKLGEEAMIALPNLAFRGKEWQDVRSAFNRAARADIVFRLYVGGTLPPPLRDQLFAISDRWLRAKGLPELGFTLGTVADVDDPHTAIAVAVDSDGRVLAFIDWLPMFAVRGWALDLMRRAPDAPPGMMEFLIGSSLRALQGSGRSRRKPFGSATREPEPCARSFRAASGTRLSLQPRGSLLPFLVALCV